MQAALDELRAEQGTDRVELGELVVIGAREKLERLRAERASTAARRRRLAGRVRGRRLPVDPASADEVRRAGWSRP